MHANLKVLVAKKKENVGCSIGFFHILRTSELFVSNSSIIMRQFLSKKVHSDNMKHRGKNLNQWPKGTVGILY